MNALILTRMFVRYLWVLLLFGVVGAASGYAMASITPRHYQSTISLQLNPASTSAFLAYGGTTGASQELLSRNPLTALAATYSEVLRSRAFGEVVVQRVQLAVEPEAIARAIDASLIPNTNIFRISVSWDQPQDARQLAQSVAEIFINENLQRQQAQPGGQLRQTDLEESARQLQSRATSLRQQRDRLDQTVSRGDLSRLNELNDLDTRLSALESSYANLLVEINRMRTSIDTATILDRAAVAVPVGSLPLTQTLLFGVLIGLALGAVVVYGIDGVHGVIRDPQEVEDLAGSAPLVAIPHFQANWSKKKPRSGPYQLISGAPRSAAAEAFRTLRATLRPILLDHPLRTLVVTSGGSGEGKTLVSTNLAIALAQSGKRVLLVDADLRRPELHAVFGVDGGVGLVDVLLQEANPDLTAEDKETIVGVVPSGVDQLWVLPAGVIPANPSELLGSDAAVRLFARLAAAWDIVIFDTPPVGPVADALLLAEHADEILLIIRSGRTPRAGLQGTIKALRNIAPSRISVVLNDLKPTPLAQYGRYAHYYAGFYGKQYFGS